MNRFLMLFAICCGCLLLGGCKSGGNSVSDQAPRPIPIPQIPTDIAPSRKGLYFGFFGTDDVSEEETFPFINMLFEAAWGAGATPEEREAMTVWLIGHMQKAKAAGITAAILDIGFCVYEKGSVFLYRGNTAAEENLIQLFKKMRQAEVLDMVVALYPVDEPDLVDVSATVISMCNATIRKVCSHFPELFNAKLAVTYTDKELYPGLDFYDWIGFDSYGNREQIFAPNGIYDRLRSVMRADQRIMLFPGGADPWKQDPMPFYQKAQEDEKVIALIPFIYISPYGDGSQKGIRDNGLRPHYEIVGKAIKSA